MTEFPDKGWTESSKYRLHKKLRNTGTMDRATQLHHKTGSFQTHLHFPDVNKYAYRQIAVLCTIPISFFIQQCKNSCENRLRIHRVKANKTTGDFKSTVHVINTKFKLLISQGSAATYLRCTWHCYMNL